MTGRSRRRSTRLARRSRRRFPICQGEGWLLAQLGARPSIGNQFILRSSSGLSQPPLCTALPHPLHYTALLFLVLHNALYTMLFTPLKMFCTVLHLILNFVLHCWTVWLNSAVLTSQRRRSPPSNANCRSSNFSRCVFSNPPYFLPYLPKAFSALGQSPRNLLSQLKFSTIVTIFVSKLDLRRKSQSRNLKSR